MRYRDLTRSSLSGIAAFTTIAVIALQAGEGPSPRDAASLRQKVAAITMFSERPSREARRTTVTENEVNAYLSFDAADSLPPGVIEPAISILGTGRLAGRAVVDLDAVKKQKNPSSVFDPTSYLTGRLPITAIGVLTTSNGVARFNLESATVSSVPIPKMLLQEIVSHYSRSPEHPAGVSMDTPFPLPAKIREIYVERGQATIVQ
jgi:hypothetical protein